jgi:ABC-type glycerol-3-phosphate transport system permease component
MSRRTLRTLIRAAAVAALAAVALLPLAWLVTGALAMRDGGPPSLIPMVTLFRAEPYGAWLLNSLFVACVQTLLAVLLCSTAGFALWAYRFRGRRVLIALLAGTVIVPAQVVLPGLFVLITQLGWLDTFAAVILPGAISAFGVFLFATSFRHVPLVLLDAARIDGCPEWRLWWSIALPIVRPTTAAFLLLGFLAAWNNLLWPAAVLVSERHYTLPIGLSHMASQPAYEADPGPLMAATLLSVLPVVGLFFLCQRELVSGIAGRSGR